MEHFLICKFEQLAVKQLLFNNRVHQNVFEFTKHTSKFYSKVNRRVNLLFKSKLNTKKNDNLSPNSY